MWVLCEHSENMNTMGRTVILVIAIVISNSYGKIVLTENNLIDPSINEISKVEKEIILQPLVETITAHVDPKTNITLVKTELLQTNDTSNNATKIDTGVPLILTDLLEKGQFEEARNACKVDSSLFLGIESYSGFLTVNKTYNSNLFFWYFPVQNKPVNETPWIIWLQGGPGASSLTGLFDEIGPFKVYNGNTLKENPYTWLKNHSLLFIDNPVGSGYSFTEHKDGFVKLMPTYASHLFSTVQQFLQIFPELRAAPLFIAGESYAGKYVPALGMELHKHKNNSGQEVNLQGLMVGNGYMDPAMISRVTQPFYYFGLLEKEQIDVIDPLLKAFQRDIANNNSIAAKEKWTHLIFVLLFLSHQKQAYNFLKDDLSVGRFSTYLKRPEVKKAIHVGELPFSFVNFTTNLELAPDFLSSSKPIFEQLLEHYRVLAYCGQLDQMLPCVFTSENYRTWQWSGSEEFLRATRYPFMVNNRLAGYTKSGGHLTEVVVRGAGHMVPLDAPGAARALAERWTRAAPLASRSQLLEGPFLLQYIANNTAAAAYL